MTILKTIRGSSPFQFYTSVPHKALIELMRHSLNLINKYCTILKLVYISFLGPGSV